MCDPRILGLLFTFVGHVQQDIEARKIRVTVNDRQGLLVLYLHQLMYGSQEFLEKPVFLLAKSDLRKVRMILASFLSHI